MGTDLNFYQVKCRICGEPMEIIENTSVWNNELFSDRFVPAEDTLVDILYCKHCCFYSMSPQLQEDHYRTVIDYTITSRYNTRFCKYIERNLKIINNNVAKHDLLIDIGCGEGDFLSMAAPCFKEAIGIEPSKATLILEQKALKYINDYFSKDLELFKTQKADAFYCSMIFEHLEDPLSMLKDIHEVCDDGAVGVIVVPNGFDIINKKQIRHLQVEHINYFSIPSLFKLAVNAGFNVISTEIFALNDLMLVVKKEPRGVQSFDLKKNTINDFCLKLPKSKKICAYGASCRTATVMRMVEKNLLVQKWYDSNINLHGKYICGCKTIISCPEKDGRICDNDIVLLFGTVYDEEITKALRNEYQYKGEILVIPA